MSAVASAPARSPERSGSGASVPVARLLAAAFGISVVYTVITTLTGRAPSDVDATTPVV